MRKIIQMISKAGVWVITLLIRFYQRFISPLTPPMCKYYPTCSSYAVTAYKKHGVIRGTVLTVWRLCRCNPWSYGGVDHVPEKFTRIYFVPKKAADVYANDPDDAEDRENGGL